MATIEERVSIVEDAIVRIERRFDALATKQDLDALATKETLTEDFKHLDGHIGDVQRDVKEIKDHLVL